MNIKNNAKLLAASALLIGANAASAAIIASDTTTITSSGQSYQSADFAIDTSYDIYTLNVTARGDYGSNNPDEWINIDILDYHNDLATADHTGFLGTPSYSWGLESYSIETTKITPHFNWILDMTFVFDTAGFLFDAATFHGNNFDLSWQNGPQTNSSSSHYVSWSLEGTNVPEPTTLSLLALGLAGLGFSRKRQAR